MLLLSRIIFLFACFVLSGKSTAASLPPRFVYLADVIPTIEFDIRYARTDNFVGMPVDGYLRPVAITTRITAVALEKVQNDLKHLGLGLKIFDAYRPQRAVNHFIRWANDWNDTRMQPAYYPHIAKKDLFREEYIAEKPGHSRGSAIDLTLIYRDKNGLSHELDMGTPFDFFDPRSWPSYTGLTAAQSANRQLLQKIMMKHGFKPYPKEWWHFTLKNEPFPDTYFDFPIE